MTWMVGGREQIGYRLFRCRSGWECHRFGVVSYSRRSLYGCPVSFRLFCDSLLPAEDAVRYREGHLYAFPRNEETTSENDHGSFNFLFLNI